MTESPLVVEANGYCGGSRASLLMSSTCLSYCSLGSGQSAESTLGFLVSYRYNRRYGATAWSDSGSSDDGACWSWSERSSSLGTLARLRCLGVADLVPSAAEVLPL